MKVAYWPGCVSRGFTPELHGSMAKVAPLLDLELIELDRAACCGAGVIDEHNQRARYLQREIDVVGGTVSDYAGVYKCCGSPIVTMNKEASLKMAGRHVGDAIDAEADCLVVPCPLCHLNPDLQRPAASKV